MGEHRGVKTPARFPLLVATAALALAGCAPAADAPATPPASPTPTSTPTPTPTPTLDPLAG